MSTHNFIYSIYVYTHTHIQYIFLFLGFTDDSYSLVKDTQQCVTQYPT